MRERNEEGEKELRPTGEKSLQITGNTDDRKGMILATKVAAVAALATFAGASAAPPPAYNTHQTITPITHVHSTETLPTYHTPAHHYKFTTTHIPKSPHVRTTTAIKTPHYRTK